MSETESNARRQAEQGDNPTFTVAGVEVHDSGRVTIPSRFRDRYSIVEGDILDVRVRAEAVTFWALDLPVDASGRIRIPSRKREIYDLSDEEIIDVDVMVTPMCVGDDE